MNFSEIKKSLVIDRKHIRRASWQAFITIAIDDRGFSSVYHDTQRMNPWYPSDFEIEATDWEVAP